MAEARNPRGCEIDTPGHATARQVDDDENSNRNKKRAVYQNATAIFAEREAASRESTKDAANEIEGPNGNYIKKKTRLIWRLGSDPTVCSPADDLGEVNPLSRQYWARIGTQVNQPSPEDVESVRTAAENLSGPVLSLWRELAEYANDHYKANMIRVHWTRASRSQRRALLLSLDPSMAKRHRPDWDAMWNRSKSEPRDSFLLPAINVQDLVEEDNLLVFMKSRADNPPSDFAQQDLESARLGVLIDGLSSTEYPALYGFAMLMEKQAMEITYGRVLGPQDLEHYILQTDALRTGYGQLISPEDAMPVFKYCVATGNGLGERRLWTPQPGLLVLEIQKRKLEFLLKCCKKMLEEQEQKWGRVEFEPSAPGLLPKVSTAIPAQCGPNSADERLCSTLISRAAYRVPSLPNFSQMLELLRTRLDAAYHHIWDLKQDPSYFHQTVLLYMLYDARAPSDLGGAEKPVMTPSKDKISLKELRQKLGKAHIADREVSAKDRSWDRVLSTVIHDAYYDFCLWKCVWNGLRDLHTKYKAHHDGIVASGRLPEGFDKYFFYFTEEVLGRIRDESTNKLINKEKLEKLDLPFVDTFCLLDDIDGHKHRQLNSKQRMYYLLDFLHDIDHHEGIGVSNMVDCIDTQMNQLLEKEPSSFTPWHARLVADLGIYAEISRQFKIYDQQFLSGILCSKYKSLDVAGRARYEAFVGETYRGTPALCIPTDALNKIVFDKASARFFKQHVSYPSKNKRSMVLAETHLANIWTVFEAFINPGLPVPVDAYLGLRFTITRTQLIQSPTLAESSKSPGNVTTAETKTVPEHDVPKIDHVPAHQRLPARDFVLPLPPKELRKMRDREESFAKYAQPEPEVGPAPATPAAPATIIVKEPHYTTMRGLWSNVEVREVLWIDLLKAMAEIGFNVQKLQGSSWQFSPTEAMGLKNSIVFHEPHPKKALTPEEARRDGRRLNRNYGWSSETFVLDDGKAEDEEE